MFLFLHSAPNLHRSSLSTHLLQESNWLLPLAQPSGSCFIVHYSPLITSWLSPLSLSINTLVLTTYLCILACVVTEDRTKDWTHAMEPGLSWRLTCWRNWSIPSEPLSCQLQLVTSQGSHLTSGKCWLSQGLPRMIYTVGPSSTRTEIVSSCRHPTHRPSSNVSWTRCFREFHSQWRNCSHC